MESENEENKKLSNIPAWVESETIFLDGFFFAIVNYYAISFLVFVICFCALYFALFSRIVCESFVIYKEEDIRTEKDFNIFLVVDNTLDRSLPR